MSYRLEILHGSSYGPTRHKGHPCKEKLAWNPCKKIPWTMELAITQRFFELDNQDFAWKFVWTIHKNGHLQKYMIYKWIVSHITSPRLEHSGNVLHFQINASKTKQLLYCHYQSILSITKQ